MAFTVDRSFFVAFLEETVQKMPTSFAPASLFHAEPCTPLGGVKLVCTKLCHTLFGDDRAQLKKKNDKDFLIVAKGLGFYSVYNTDKIAHARKNEKVSENV